MLAFPSIRTILLLAGFALGEGNAAAGDRLDFRRQVQPILADRCFACHGPDGQNRKANLRLDQKAGLMKSVKANDPVASELVRRIASHDPDEVMPPARIKKPLTEKEIATLRRWVHEGAEWNEHWAWKPPKSIGAPTSPSSGNSIDAFLADRLRREKVQPTAQADRPTLIRRVAFTLTGLPPTLGELDHYLAD